jgi:serine/threonine-protein kinase
VAYNSYIQGRYQMHRFGPDTFRNAKQLFEDAIRRDPQFALAYDALADLYWSLAFTGLAAPRDVVSPGLFCALRAVEIDSTLAETRAMVAQYRLRVDFDWPEVEREMRAALQLNPASPIVRLRYACSGLMPQGRLDEAIAQIKQALELDPLDSWARSWLVVMLWLARRADMAIDEARTAIDLDPGFPNHHMQLGVALCQAGRCDEAIAALRQAASMTPVPLPLGWLGLALALGGSSVEARQLLDRLHAMAGRGYVPPTAFAWVHLGLGETDEAFAWMDKAIDTGDGMMTPIKSYWFVDPIRADPRFHALLRRMKLE